MNRGGYTAEQAGAIAERVFTSSGTAESLSRSITQELASGHWMQVVDEAIDLSMAMTGRSVANGDRSQALNGHLRKQVVKFMVLGYQPKRVGGKYPDVQALAAEIALRITGNGFEGAQGHEFEVAVLSKELREVRAARALATAMSGRRSRQPVLVAVDRRLQGKPCSRCRGKLMLGVAVFHDRDWGNAWHVAGGCGTA